MEDQTETRPHIPFYQARPQEIFCNRTSSLLRRRSTNCRFRMHPIRRSASPSCRSPWVRSSHGIQYPVVVWSVNATLGERSPRPSAPHFPGCECRLVSGSKPEFRDRRLYSRGFPVGRRKSGNASQPHTIQYPPQPPLTPPAYQSHPRPPTGPSRPKHGKYLTNGKQSVRVRPRSAPWTETTEHRALKTQSTPRLRARVSQEYGQEYGNRIARVSQSMSPILVLLNSCPRRNHRHPPSRETTFPISQ